MTDSPRHSVSVAGAVVREDGKVLCIRRQDNGHWEPPGGVLELEERIHDALLREIREETGLEVEAGPLTGIYQNQPRSIVALVFRCHATGGILHTSHETTELEWLERPEIVERMTEAYAVRVTDALDFVGSPAFRTHDGVRLND